MTDPNSSYTVEEQVRIDLRHVTEGTTRLIQQLRRQRNASLTYREVILQCLRLLNFALTVEDTLTHQSSLYYPSVRSQEAQFSQPQSHVTQSSMNLENYNDYVDTIGDLKTGLVDNSTQTSKVIPSQVSSNAITTPFSELKDTKVASQPSPQTASLQGFLDMVRKTQKIPRGFTGGSAQVMKVNEKKKPVFAKFENTEEEEKDKRKSANPGTYNYAEAGDKQTFQPSEFFIKSDEIADTVFEEANQQDISEDSSDDSNDDEDFVYYDSDYVDDSRSL